MKKRPAVGWWKGVPLAKTETNLTFKATVFGASDLHGFKRLGKLEAHWRQIPCTLGGSSNR